MKRKKIKWHRVAVTYLKKHGIKLKSGNWSELTPMLIEISGISVGYRGHKAGGVMILKRLAGVPIKGPMEKKVVKSSVNSKDFLQTYAWRKLRMQALIKYGAKCMCCGRTPADGAVMNVDHIKPRKTHPELALDIKNLQILCGTCNHGKGNWDQTDWREPDLAVLMGEKMA